MCMYIYNLNIRICTHVQYLCVRLSVCLNLTRNNVSKIFQPILYSINTISGQTLRFYCRDCETAVCSSCTDIEHRTHNTLHLTDAVDEHRAAMHQLIDRVTMQVGWVPFSSCIINQRHFCK